jgi:hypothetical protein
MTVCHATLTILTNMKSIAAKFNINVFENWNI